MYEKEIDLKQLLSLLRKHLPVFAGVIVVVLTLTFIYIQRSPVIYSAIATVEIEPKTPDILGSGMEIVSSGSQGYYWSNKEYYATQYEIIQSRAVSQKVIDMIPDGNVLNFFGIDTSLLKEREDVEKIDPVKILQGKIFVAPQKNSNIVRISIEDTDPEKAAFLANSVSSAYIDFNLEKRYVTTRDAATWLADQSINLKKELETSELQLFNFKDDNNILATTFEARQTILSKRIETLNNIITAQEIKRNALLAKIEEYRKIDIDDPEDGYIKDISKENQLVYNLRLKYLEALAKFKEIEKTYGELHPRQQTITAEISKTKDLLRSEINGVVQSYDIELRTLESELGKNRKMLSDVQSEAIDLNRLSIDYSKLKREVDTNQRMFEIVLERTKQADLSALLRNNNLRVVDRAEVPTSPVKPRKKLILLIGLLVAFMAGFLAIVLIEFLETRFRDFEELEKASKKSILGVVPKFKADSGNGVDPLEIVFEQKGQFAAIEAFRTLRTNIKLGNPDKEIKKILITSSLKKEGKTILSVNIASSYVLAGKKVVIVDADMRKPRIHKIFNIKNDIGLSTAVIGEVPLEKAIDHDVYKGLDVLTSGSVPPNPAELIESKRFADVLEQLSSMYDMIVIDSPPLTPVSDAATLSTLTDGVLIVIDISKTPRDVYRSAIEKISKPGIRFLGTIVNMLDSKERKRFASYYQYYHYEQYDSKPDKKKR
jgi:polysaccharide biosynthesis transport protein